MSLVQNFQICVYLVNALVCGFIYSVLGPSLPDLQCLYMADLKSLSLLFLFFGLGGAIARSVSGLIYPRVSSPHGLLLLCSMLHCAACSSLPFSSTVALAYVLIFVQGSSNGFSMSGILYMTLRLWPDNSRLTHLIYTFSSVGSSLGPLILTPFLSDGYLTQLYNNKLRINWITNMTSEDSVSETPSAQNMTTHCRPADNFATLIQYPFLIIGCLHIPVIGGYLILILIGNATSVCPEEKGVSERRNLLPPTPCYLIGMFLFFLQGQGIPSSFSGLMTTYGIRNLNISLQNMSWMTSLFWAVFTVTRMSVSLIPADCKQIYIICTSIAGSSIGVSVLVSTLSGQEATLWVSALILAASSSPMLPTLVNWGVQTVEVTPNVTAMFLVATITGSALPSVCGYIMDMFGTRLFIVYFVVFHFFNCFIFCFLVTYVYFLM